MYVDHALHGDHQHAEEVNKLQIQQSQEVIIYLTKFPIQVVTALSYRHIDCHFHKTLYYNILYFRFLGARVDAIFRKRNNEREIIKKIMRYIPPRRVVHLGHIRNTRFPISISCRHYTITHSHYRLERSSPKNVLPERAAPPPVFHRSYRPADRIRGHVPLLGYSAEHLCHHSLPHAGLQSAHHNNCSQGYCRRLLPFCRLPRRIILV